MPLPHVIYLKTLPYTAVYRKPNHSKKYQVPQWPGTCWTLILTCKFFAWAESWVTLAWSSALSVESFFFSVSSCVCCIVSSDTLFLRRTATVRSCNEQILSLLYALHNTDNLNTYRIGHVCPYAYLKWKTNGHIVMKSHTGELKENLSHQFNLHLDWTILMSWHEDHSI